MVREIQAREKFDEKLVPSLVRAAMPPFECVKAWISHMRTEQTKSTGECLVMLRMDTQPQLVFTVSVDDESTRHCLPDTRSKATLHCSSGPRAAQRMLPLCGKPRGRPCERERRPFGVCNAALFAATDLC